MNDDISPEPAPAPPRPQSAGVGTMTRSLGVGIGGGTIASIVATYFDPTRYSAVFAGISAVSLGFANGLSEVWIKHRRGMIGAEAEPNRLARIEAERRHEECERRHEECERNHVDLARRLDRTEARCDELAAKVDAKDRAHDESMAKAEDRYRWLWDQYERDRNKGLQSDQPGRVHP